MTATLVEAGGLAWGVRAWGPADAPPIVLLHGFGGDGRHWAAIAEALAGRWRVLAPDLPGHGATAAPTPPEAWDLARAGAALNELLAALGAAGAPLVGYSLGGRLALHAALAAVPGGPTAAAGRPAVPPATSGRLGAGPAGLVLIGASPGLPDHAARAERVAADAAWIAKLGEGLPAFLAAWEAQPLFATRQARPESTRAAADAVRRGQDPAGLAAAMAAFGLGRQAWLGDRLPALAMPAVLVAGEHDAKFRAIAAEMAARLPHATLHVAPGAGHDVPLERPASVCEAIARLAVPKGALT